MSFQFARVSPSVSGFEDLALEDGDEDVYYYYLYYSTTLILFRCIVIWYVYFDMYCIDKIKGFVKQLHELYILIIIFYPSAVRFCLVLFLSHFSYLPNKNPPFRIG